MLARALRDLATGATLASMRRPLAGVRHRPRRWAAALIVAFAHVVVASLTWAAPFVPLATCDSLSNEPGHDHLGTGCDCGVSCTCCTTSAKRCLVGAGTELAARPAAWRPDGVEEPRFWGADSPPPSVDATPPFKVPKALGRPT